MFGRVRTNDVGLNKSFSILLMNNSRLQLFVGFELYRGPQRLPCLGGGDRSEASSGKFWFYMGFESSCWFWWSWLNWDCFNLKRSWFTNLVKSLRNSYQLTSFGVGIADGPFDRRDLWRFDLGYSLLFYSLYLRGCPLIVPWGFYFVFSNDGYHCWLHWEHGSLCLLMLCLILFCSIFVNQGCWHTMTS